jgi:hypothetical protein
MMAEDTRFAEKGLETAKTLAIGIQKKCKGLTGKELGQRRRAVAAGLGLRLGFDVADQLINMVGAAGQAVLNVEVRQVFFFELLDFVAVTLGLHFP